MLGLDLALALLLALTTLIQMFADTAIYETEDCDKLANLANMPHVAANNLVEVRSYATETPARDLRVPPTHRIISSGQTSKPSINMRWSETDRLTSYIRKVYLIITLCNLR